MCEVFSLVNPNKVFTNSSERDEYDKAYRAIQVLGECANSSSIEPTLGCLDGFTNEHRTLQQSIVRMLHKALIMWACGREEGLVDARNQASWEFAQFLREQDISLPLI